MMSPKLTASICRLDFFLLDSVLGLTLVLIPDAMWLAVFVCICFAVYVYLSEKLRYWERLGVRCPEPNLLFGNFARVVTMQENLGQAYSSWYNQFKNAPYVGFYKMRQPGVLLRDAELVKNIMIRDFDSFGKNDVDIDEENDPLMARNPFCQEGDAWKRGRGQITPAFSSGKMKVMFPLIDEVSKRLVRYIDKEKHSPIEGRDLCAKFTTDNVATCAFGLEANSFDDPGSEFRKMGHKIFDQSLVSGFKIMAAFVFPVLAKMLRIQVLPAVIGDYFSAIVGKTLKYRKEHKIVRNDFLDMMADLKVKQPDMSQMDIVAHAVGFFGDGFQTSSSAMSFALYCFGKNAHVQEKLRNHINGVLDKHQGKMTYEALQDMNYLEMALSESLRLFPPLMSLSKVCTKAYRLPPANADAAEVTLKPGTPIAIAAFGLHRDPKYFPDPEKYDPERFSEENKRNMVKGSYLPFGEGPRICLGQRFGLMQVKMGLAEIVRNYKVTVDSRTKDPIQIDPRSFITGALGGVWLNFEKV